MNERQVDPWPDLICGNVVIEVGANTPEVFVRTDDLHPSASWRLQQRMNQKQQEPAPRGQYPGNFLHGSLERLDVFDRQAEHDRVEPSVPAGKLMGTGL